MTDTRTRFLALAATPGLALALMVAGCNKAGDTDAGATAGPVPTSAAALPKVPAPAGKPWAEVIEATPEGGYRMGNPDAAIKLVEYGSLSCPHCAHLAEEAFNPLTSDFVSTGRVSFEYRSFAIHPQDVPLTMLAQCADKGAFFALVEQIYGNFDQMAARTTANAPAIEAAMKLPADQRFIGMAQAMGLTEFFAARGVSKQQAEMCLVNSNAATQIAANAQTWGNKGIDSTPTLFINNRKIDEPTWATLKTALQNAGAR